MIQIDFFTVPNDRRSFKRTFTELFTCIGSFKNETNIINPIFIISKNFDDVFICNYVHVWAPINRFYFVDDVKIVGNYFEIHCSIDVLFTYKPQILEKTCLIKRQEKNYAGEEGKFFYDEQLPVLQSKNVSYYRIGECANNHGYYLTVNGGVQ